MYSNQDNVTQQAKPSKIKIKIQCSYDSHTTLQEHYQLRHYLCTPESDVWIVTFKGQNIIGWLLR